MTKKSEYDALMKEYRKLAKRADQRLVRLEQLSQQDSFVSVLKYSYKNAMKSIKKWSGEMATRFNTKPPGTEKELRGKLSDIKKFLSRVTSTKKGIISVYKKRANTLNTKYGTDFTWQDLGYFFESPEFEKYGNEETGYGSKTYTMAVGVMQENEKNLIKAIKKKEKIDIDVKDEKVNEAFQDLLNKYGLDFTSLYKKK